MTQLIGRPDAKPGTPLSAHVTYMGAYQRGDALGIGSVRFTWDWAQERWEFSDDTVSTLVAARFGQNDPAPPLVQIIFTIGDNAASRAQPVRVLAAETAAGVLDVTKPLLTAPYITGPDLAALIAQATTARDNATAATTAANSAASTASNAATAAQTAITNAGTATTAANTAAAGANTAASAANTAAGSANTAATNASTAAGAASTAAAGANTAASAATAAAGTAGTAASNATNAAQAAATAASQALGTAGIAAQYVSATTADPTAAPDGTRGAKRDAYGNLVLLTRTAGAWVPDTLKIVSDSYVQSITPEAAQVPNVDYSLFPPGQAIGAQRFELLNRPAGMPLPGLGGSLIEPWQFELDLLPWLMAADVGAGELYLQVITYVGCSDAAPLRVNFLNSIYTQSITTDIGTQTPDEYAGAGSYLLKRSRRVLLSEATAINRRNWTRLRVQISAPNGGVEIFKLSLIVGWQR